MASDCSVGSRTSKSLLIEAHPSTTSTTSPKLSRLNGSCAATSLGNLANAHQTTPKLAPPQGVLGAPLLGHLAHPRLALREAAQGLDAEVREPLSAPPHHPRHFGDGTPDGVGVHPSGHAADVRQFRQA